MALRPLVVRQQRLRFRILGGLAFAAALCGPVAAYMLGAHVLIGIGEGLITAVTATAVAKARPDLVYLLRTAPRRVEVRA